MKINKMDIAEVDISGIIKKLLSDPERLSKSQLEFVSGCEKYFRLHGCLTRKQTEILCDIDHYTGSR
jgi:hypothetical protein